jgi:hypothetical protein
MSSIMNTPIDRLETVAQESKSVGCESEAATIIDDIKRLSNLQDERVEKRGLERRANLRWPWKSPDVGQAVEAQDAFVMVESTPRCRAYIGWAWTPNEAQRNISGRRWLGSHRLSTTDDLHLSEAACDGAAIWIHQ